MAMELAKQLADQLASRATRVVLAESCTGGRVAAELSSVAGISEWFCGSAVTYRCDTKIRWIDVRPDAIAQHTAVSEEVACQMARGVLSRTPEASLAASITGHFGPDAPPGFDGTVFVGIAVRDGEEVCVEVTRHHLETEQRDARQTEATNLVLRLLIDMLERQDRATHAAD